MSGYSIFEETMVDLTFPQVEAAAARGAAVLVPSGVVEQHGPHLPTGTDTGSPKSMAFMPRTMPSVGSMATQRTPASAPPWPSSSPAT